MKFVKNLLGVVNMNKFYVINKIGICKFKYIIRRIVEIMLSIYWKII